MRIKPWPDVKFVTRPPATAKPSQVLAALCSDSGSMKANSSSERFRLPFATSSWYPPPMVVDDVIGYAHAPWVTWVSTQTTIPAPSEVVGIPGNGGFCSFDEDSRSVVGPWLFRVVLTRPPCYLTYSLSNIGAYHKNPLPAVSFYYYPYPALGFQILCSSRVMSGPSASAIARSHQEKSGANASA